MTDLYAGADKAIKLMNRENLKRFGRLKLAKFDEINVVRMVNSIYEESIRNAKQRYYEIAVEAYILAAIECGIENKQATIMADKDISIFWVTEMLDEVDPVMLYAFMTEADRKKQRLIESLSVAENKNAEIDKALKYWTVQVGQFADNSVYRARLEAFSAAGIEEVQWVAQMDDRVCTDCENLNGQIFPIEAVPPPQHPHCRCELHRVL